MSNVRVYDTAKMRNAAAEIREKIRVYDSAHETITSTVDGLKAYWDDATNQQFVARYFRDLDPTATDICQLMAKYADFLDESARVIDDVINKGNAAINGQ